MDTTTPVELPKLRVMEVITVITVMAVMAVVVEDDHVRRGNDEKGVVTLTVYGGGRPFVNWEDQVLPMHSRPNIASQAQPV